MNFLSTVKGSALEGFYPEGWDFEKIEKICALSTKELLHREAWWHDDFRPVSCKSLADFEVMLGYESRKKSSMRAGKRSPLFCRSARWGCTDGWCIFCAKKISPVKTFILLTWMSGQTGKETRWTGKTTEVSAMPWNRRFSSLWGN